ELTIGPIASSDVAFDDAGNLVGSDNEKIYKTPYDGEPVVFVDDVDFRAAMRYLPDGHLVYADEELGRLMRVDLEGQQHEVLTDLDDPNGITVDPLGFVYISEEGGGRVLRVDPHSNEFTVLIDDLPKANDLTFNVDYDLLYVGTFSNLDNTIYTMEIDVETGDHGELTPWVTDLGSGFHDGLKVDICDNVYVCDYECGGEWDKTCIFRLSPDGVVEEEMLIVPSLALYFPNFDWGSGIGGWDPETIYAPNGWAHQVWQVHVGVESKPRVYP
ncbi:MAG: SMP-30/gluconolactonase/LRE family protein, partial [Deltaproteobacteria bacterium]|nr:SMP-30/gluconolactonase/LRE family protein [Deltaproteobacteria bacterium]